MSRKTNGTFRPLTRPEQKELVALVCAADRLEWQLRARRYSRARSWPPRWLMPAARLGLAWFPRQRRREAARGGHRAWFWIRTALDLFG